MTPGPPAVAEIIDEQGWSYPVSVRRLEQECALKNVQIDERGNSIMLGELLQEVGADRFESEDDLYETLEPVFEAERERRHVGFFGKVKQLFLGTYTR